MKITHCDRCGVKVKAAHVELQLTRAGGVVVMGDWYNEREFDLCARCAYDFKNWFGKEENNT